MLMCLRLIVFFYSGYQKRHDENVGLSIVNLKLNNINNVTIPSVHRSCSTTPVREVSAPLTVFNSTGVVVYIL